MVFLGKDRELVLEQGDLLAVMGTAPMVFNGIKLQQPAPPN